MQNNKPKVIYEWGSRSVYVRVTKNMKMEAMRLTIERGREEKVLNDETICSVKLLDHTSTNGKTSSMATSSVTKREAAISLNTPIFFSLTTPLLFPNYKACCIYHRVNTKRYRDKYTHIILSFLKPKQNSLNVQKQINVTQQGLYMYTATQI